jgi:hypothetical protein
MPKTIWEQFFDAHAPIYDDNVFTKNTVHLTVTSNCLPLEAIE